MSQSLNVGTVQCVANRKELFSWTMKVISRTTGAQVALGSSDIIQFKLGSSPDAAASLTFTSASPSLAGSRIMVVSVGSTTADAYGTVELVAGDTSLLAGLRKSFEINIVFDADSTVGQPIRGVMAFLPAMT